MSQTQKPKILLLNPPGQKVYLRDYFCSKVSQADYVNHPIDLVCLSGLLLEAYEVAFIDGIVERLDEETCLTRIRHQQPDVIIGLIGSVSYAEDVPFYQQVAGQTDASLILIGDILIDQRTERLRQLPFVDAFLHDFSTDDVHRFLRHDGELKNMTVRVNGRVEPMPIDRPRHHTWDLPVPAHHLFVDKPYRYPFVRRHRFATVMTEFGCPYRCSFCIMSTLGWKVRSVDNVMVELDRLRELKIRELFFLDQTFGMQKTRAKQLLEAMTAYDFGWVCFSRPDILDAELLGWMKAAGCHTIILGLESGSQEILDAAQKDYDLAAVQAGFRLCAEHGIRTVATVIVGLPEETQETFAETMALLKTIAPDFASFNVAVPRMGTPFRERALDLGLVTSDMETMDQSGHPVAMPSLTLSQAEVRILKQRAIREFYLNFGYIRKRLQRFEWHTKNAWYDVTIQLRQGYGLLRSYFAL